jgi:hypothetical protein
MSNVYINPILSIREHAKEIENGTYSGLELARKFLTFKNDRGYLENCASAIAKDVFYCKKSDKTCYVEINKWGNLQAVCV